MTIPSTARRSTVYVGNGAATEYTFPFAMQDEDDIRVVVAGPNGENPTDLAKDHDFTVVLFPDQAHSPGGRVLYSGLPVGDTLVILSAVEASQPTELRNQGPFHPKTIEDALDRIVILIQQLQEGLARAVRLPVTTTDVDPREWLAGALCHTRALSQAAEDASAAAYAWANKMSAPVEGSGYSARYHAERAESASRDFRAMYMGARAVAPLETEEGAPLRTGAVYFDTGLERWQVWTGTTWVNPLA